MRSLRSLHQSADHFATSFVPRGRLYPEGFGDFDRLEALVDQIRHYESTPPGDVELTIERRRRRPGWTLIEASYRSPASYLPPESRTGRLEIREPSGDRKPICLLFAATGEEGFLSRRPFALTLLRAGIGSAIIETPYYGSRRRHGQKGALLRTVDDQFAMNLATVDEGRALVRYFARSGYETIGLTGYSQGGMMAAFTAALSEHPVIVMPRGSGCSAVPIFTESALSMRMNWELMAQQKGGRDAAREYFAECLQPVDVSRMPPPKRADLAILIHSRGDGFVPAAEARSLNRHWPGSELRWIPAGHLTGLLLYPDAHRAAVLDAFKRAHQSNTASAKAIPDDSSRSPGG
ncbi:MAG: alpha/beta hydrolase family protein [Myxococcota bacterium]